MDDSDKKMLLTFMAPYFMGVIIVTVFLVLVCFKYVPFFKRISSPSVVVFDINKYVNAQRKVASAFLGNPATQDIGAANETLANLSARTKAAIYKFAGPNTLVVIKQAVIEGNVLDITEDVLAEVGLPSDVPTQDLPRAVLNPVVTQSQLTDGRLANPGKSRDEIEYDKQIAADAVKDKKLPELP